MKLTLKQKWSITPLNVGTLTHYSWVVEESDSKEFPIGKKVDIFTMMDLERDKTVELKRIHDNLDGKEPE